MFFTHGELTVNITTPAKGLSFSRELFFLCAPDKKRTVTTDFCHESAAAVPIQAEPTLRYQSEYRFRMSAIRSADKGSSPSNGYVMPNSLYLKTPIV